MTHHRIWALAIHGGVDPRSVTPYTQEQSNRRHQALAAALQAGEAILSQGGSSLNAPDFNAGCGATLTHEGHVELDAAIMEGRERRVGAASGLRRIRNPIDLARCILERSDHVFLNGEGAEQFAATQGIVFTDPEYFLTQGQMDQLRKVRDKERPEPTQMSGTVGAVALDQAGDLAAATSTGGMTNKRYGRVGDSPVIGACIYAENDVCAVSTTGCSEYFIRNVAAHDVYARMKYAHESIDGAAREVIQRVSSMGGYGGAIALDAQGNIATPYSTPRMAHGYVVAGKTATIILKDN